MPPQTSCCARSEKLAIIAACGLRTAYTQPLAPQARAISKVRSIWFDEVRPEAPEAERLNDPEDAGLVELRDPDCPQTAQPFRLGLALDEARPQPLSRMQKVFA